MQKSDIDRIKAKQLAFNQLKIHHSIKNTSQEAFDSYIYSLQKEETCKYMTGISGIINLCNIDFNCKFKGEIYKSFTKNPKRECLREKIIKFEKILES